MNELSLEVIHSQIPAKMRPMVDDDVMQEIQKLSEDPDYGDEFLDVYIDYLNVLRDSPRRNHQQYMKAIKFFTLVEAEHSLTDAYIKVFPERYETRTRNSPEPDPNKKKQIMRGEASRYNSTQLVTEIRKAATVPVQLIHRHLLHEAILVNADLMHNSRSDMVKQKAADTLIRELKPAEDAHIEVAVAVKSTVIDDYERSMRLMVEKQQELIAQGGDLKTITNAPIKVINPVEPEEEPEEPKAKNTRWTLDGD